MSEEVQLAAKGIDHTVTGLKGVLGAIPIVGSLVAEIVGAVIPNQRVDRLVDFTQKLSAKLDDQSRILLQNRIVEPEGVDILEEALWQSARALSEERRQRIASLVKNALSREEVNLIESKKLLLVLSQLNDLELLLLRSYAEPQGGASDFMRTHGEELKPVHAYLRAPKALLDKHAIRKSMDDHLKMMGLISPFFWTARRGEPPEFDQDTGTLKPSHHHISLLGRLLLREIDFYPDNDKFYDRSKEAS
jgi:hypothetical protein